MHDNEDKCYTNFKNGLREITHEKKATKDEAYKR